MEGYPPGLSCDSTGIIGFGPAGKLSFSGLPYNDPEPLGEFTVLTLPLKRANNLMIVEAQIDSLVGNFVLDFGAPYLVLNKTYFRNYQKDHGRNSGNISSSGMTALRTRVNKLELLDLYFQNVDADVVNLGAIEDKRGIKILGLLGVNLFKGLEVEIDLKGNVIHLYRLDNEGARRSKSLLNSSPELELDIQLYNNVILLEGAIGKRKLRFSLDTGAEVNVLDNGLGSAVFKHFEVNRRMRLTGAEGSTVEVLAGTISEVKLGKMAFLDMKTIITNLEGMSNTYGIRIDGMLGYELISRAMVRINFNRKELKLFLYKQETE